MNLPCDCFFFIIFVLKKNFLLITYLKFLVS